MGALISFVNVVLVVCIALAIVVGGTIYRFIVPIMVVLWIIIGIVSIHTLLTTTDDEARNAAVALPCAGFSISYFIYTGLTDVFSQTGGWALLALLIEFPMCFCFVTAIAMGGASLAMSMRFKPCLLSSIVINTAIILFPRRFGL